MTRVFITIDTELSALFEQRGMTPADNLALSLGGRTAPGAFGIGWLMDQMDDHGLKGVFFVDPMPGLVHGEGLVADMVGPILAAGHEVQVHIHTEWLAWAKQAPAPYRGDNIRDYPEAEQVALIDWARTALHRAGAPLPAAFRAGNFGADDATLRALATLGFAWDSSFNPFYEGGLCRISLDRGCTGPVVHQGMATLPVSAIEDRPGQLRPAQVCAMSVTEMQAGLRHAATRGHPAFMTVSHSFEMLSRDRSRPNRMVMRRFEALCAAIAGDPGLSTGSFHGLTFEADARLRDRAGPSLPRTLARMAQQAIGTWLYERRLFPA